MLHLDNHEKIVKECKGCLRVFVTRGGMKICSCRPCPRMEWLLGKCKDSIFEEDQEKNCIVE
jgi:hypothetical protein